MQPTDTFMGARAEKNEFQLEEILLRMQGDFERFVFLEPSQQIIYTQFFTFNFNNYGSEKVLLRDCMRCCARVD